MDAISIYNYRKDFHLSYEEVINEPINDFLINSHIRAILNQKDNKESKRAAKMVK